MLLSSINNFLHMNIGKIKGPIYLFAHIFSPHPPSQYGNECLTFGISHANQLTDWTNKVAYLHNLKCVNRDVLKLLETIQTKDKTSPIIVIQSDHGSATRGQFKREFKDWNQEDFNERFSILNALLLPEKCARLLYPTLSPVNNFRIVLACMTGTMPELLEDRSYYAHLEESPHYGRVVEIPYQKE